MRPGNGTADSVAELSCWKLVSAFGCTVLVIEATFDSGTSVPDAVRIYRRGSISEGLHPTLRMPALEAAKVGNARQLSSYERQKQHRPRRSRIHCVHEFVVHFATLQECRESLC